MIFPCLQTLKKTKKTTPIIYELMSNFLNLVFKALWNLILIYLVGNLITYLLILPTW